ncbi:MAG TPA: hypothetical protein VGP93_08820, partial [Polyangiaceae bacterium]|nr:hypothetical protein [Polyangiaceae bacterium]
MTSAMQAAPAQRLVNTTASATRSAGEFGGVRLALIAVAILGACSSEKSENGTPGAEGYSTLDPVTQAIGPTGGTIGDASRASAVVPAGAVSQLVEFKISEVVGIQPGSTLELPLDTDAFSPVFAFEPHGQAFDKPVTITLAQSAGSDPELELLTTDGTTPWQTVGITSIEPTLVQADVSHFSYFVAAKHRR